MTISTRRLRLLRGNSAAVAGFTGLQGELVFNTTTYTLHLQDGSTAGGYALATAADLANVSANANYGNSNVAAYLASNSNINLTTTGVIRTSANILTDDRLVANILAIGGNLTVNQHDFVITSSDNTVVMSTGNRSTGNVSISIRANNTLSGINIRNDSGKMGFNTGASGPGNGYTFTFNGSVSASEYYASPNLPTGYQFATVDGDTGLSHAYLSGNLSVLRLRHEGVETVKFYSNKTTEMLGNIVVSDSVHYGQYPNAYLQIYGFANSYQQVINQNLSDNAAASSDFVATADNGSDTTYYINMGINSSQFAQDYWFPASNTKNDGYLYVTSYDLAGPSTANVGNLVIGSTNGIVKLFVGNTSDSNVVTTFSQNLVTVTGNILPSSNVLYSLGSATAQWKDLWLSNSTLYIDSVPITVTNGELSVNGNVIGGNSAQLSRNSYTLSLETDGNLKVPGGINAEFASSPAPRITGFDITTHSIVASGNITAGYFIGNGALLTGIAASSNYGNSNVAAYLPTYTGNIAGNIVKNGQTWTFGTNSDLTFPIGNSKIRNGYPGPAGGSGDGSSWFVTSTDGGGVASPDGKQYIQVDNVGLFIGSNFTANTGYAWAFDTDGNLKLPSNNSVIQYNNGIDILRDINSNSITANVGTFNTITTTGNITAANLNITGNIVDTGALSILSGSNGNISLQPNGTGIVAVTGALNATGNVTGNFFIGNGSLLTGIVASGSTYSNANVVSMLAANTSIALGNVVTNYPTASNITTVFIGNNTAITAGGAGNNASYMMNNLYFQANGQLMARNTYASGAGQFSIDGGTFAWNAANSATANTAAGLGARMSLTSTGLATQNSLSITSAGTLTVQGATGLVTTQTTGNLFNTTATTVNLGGAATAINMGAATTVVTVGSLTGNLLVGNITTNSNITVNNTITTGSLVLAASGAGNISGVGNIVGTTANTTITAGTYVTSFLSNGAVTTTSNVIVTGSNAISIPNLPAFRVYGTSSSNIFAGNTVTGTQGATIDYNQGSYYNNTTGIFTAPVAGLYHAYATLRVGGNNGLNQASLQKNSSTSGANVIAFWETDTNTGTASHFSMTGYAKCVAGDTIRLQVITGQVQFDANDSWGVTFIG